MRRTVLVSVSAMVIVASGIVGCTDIGIGIASGAVHVSKSAFCGANESIDRASANVTSEAGFLAALKTHAHDLTVLEKNAPPGALGQLVKHVVSGAEAAVSSNNANDLNNLPNGADIDTYCGVNGDGQALPAYFGTGKTTAFCSTFLPIFDAVSNAPTNAGREAAFTAHQTQIDQLASELSTLPKAIRAKASAAVTKAQAAIKSNNPALATSGKGSGAAGYVALYCGQNQ